MEFSKITVLIHTGATDVVILEPIGAPTAFPIMKYDIRMKLEAQAGYGVGWVREAFNREPDEIIDMKKG